MTVAEVLFYLLDLREVEVPVFLRYTDDSEMSLSVSKSLIAYKGFSAKDMASKFVYEQSSDRCYGQNAEVVFRALRKVLKDSGSDVNTRIFEAAKAQFNGSGSYGNGAAMRTAPVALFMYNKSEDEMVELAQNVAKITHAHPLGVDGAVLLCLAIRQALDLENKEVDYVAFTNALVEKMKKYQLAGEEPVNFIHKLEEMKALLDEKDIDVKKVVTSLGNEVVALKSVVTAIYCYLRTQRRSAIVQDEVTRAEMTLQMAITFGGDVDTIATMAGAITGAHLGMDAVDTLLLRNCEGRGETERLAKKFYKLYKSN